MKKIEARKPKDMKRNGQRSEGLDQGGENAEGRRGATRRKMKVDPPRPRRNIIVPSPPLPSLATSRSHSPACRARQAQRYDNTSGRPDPKWLFIPVLTKTDDDGSQTRISRIGQSTGGRPRRTVAATPRRNLHQRYQRKRRRAARHCAAGGVRACGKKGAEGWPDVRHPPARPIHSRPVPSSRRGMPLPAPSLGAQKRQKRGKTGKGKKERKKRRKRRKRRMTE